MNASELWCRAFLAAMGEHIGDLERCEEIANAALWRAQRRGMVDACAAPPQQPEVERVDFTAEPSHGDPELWVIRIKGIDKTFYVASGEDRPAGLSVALRIVWGESMPPKPIEVWIERRDAGEGGAS